MVLAVYRHTAAMISCWQCDAKHRKYHLQSVSLSNPKRLKLHLCMYGGVSLKKEDREGEGSGEREKESILMSASLLVCEMSPARS